MAKRPRFFQLTSINMIIITKYTSQLFHLTLNFSLNAAIVKQKENDIILMRPKHLRAGD